jgi:hypothetical protein
MLTDVVCRTGLPWGHSRSPRQKICYTLAAPELCQTAQVEIVCRSPFFGSRWVKRSLVLEPGQWRWSSFRHYAYGERGPVLVNEQRPRGEMKIRVA